MPPVIKFLLTANVGVFAFGFLLMPLLGGASAGEAFYHTFGLLPADFWRGAVWQPVTSMFLHGSFMHIMFNMIALWSLGMLLEQAVGSRAFAYLYGFSGIVGGFFVAVFQSSLAVPTVGASGAIAGMLGAIAILFPDSRLLLFIFPVKARTAAILLGAGSVIFSMADGGSNISHVGHLGGLVGGLLYAWLALKPKRGRASANPFGFDDGGRGGQWSGPARGPAGFGAGNPHSRSNETTYYDPVRGVTFTVGPDHPAGRGATGGAFNREQIDAMRRIQSILGQQGQAKRKDDQDDENEGDQSVRFFRPGPRKPYMN